MNRRDLLVASAAVAGSALTAQFRRHVTFQPIAALDLRPHGIRSVAGFCREFFDCKPTEHLKPHRCHSGKAQRDQEKEESSASLREAVLNLRSNSSSVKPLVD